MIQADPKGSFVLHSDLGLDSISNWRMDGATGQLSPADNSPISLPPGDGPRHFCFHPNGKSLYSIQEEASTITRFDFDQATGKLEPRQVISTLPPAFCGTSFASAVMLSPNGKYLYAGNRLHDSIAVFAVGDSGNLSYSREIWTQGSYPSNFNFDPSGGLLFCCNQNSDNVTVFRVNPKTGDLEFTGHSTSVGNPMSIVFWSEADR
jgi:6-phosphogluconolactonase